MTPDPRRLLRAIVLFVAALLSVIGFVLYRFVATNPGSHAPPNVTPRG